MRPSLGLDWHGKKVITNVADRCNNTVTVTHTGGINILLWADHHNVTAINSGRSLPRSGLRARHRGHPCMARSTRPPNSRTRSPIMPLTTRPRGRRRLTPQALMIGSHTSTRSSKSTIANSTHITF